MTTSAQIASPPAVGEQAPDFSLRSTSGETVTLSALRGQEAVLIAFFPLAFTSTCTDEMCSFSEEHEQFAGRGVRVLPVSVDSVPTLREYKGKYGLRLDLLSDFHREASRAYGVLNAEKFYSTRSYFLVDRDGIVRWAHVETKSGMRRQNAELLEAIAQLG